MARPRTNGFGTLLRNLHDLAGNDIIHLLTQTNQMLNIDMKEIEGEDYSVNYTHFAVDSEDNLYQLSVS